MNTYDYLSSRDTRLKLNLSAHLCGGYVDGFLTGHDLDLNMIAPGLFDLVQRYQINTHAAPHKWDTGVFDVANHLAKASKQVIFQLDGRDGTALAKQFVANGWRSGIAGLFDLSHGAGVLPKNWPKPISDLHCGYAGGLSPSNVAEQLGRIGQVCKQPTWIDAETHLRSNSDYSFDLGLADKFIEAAKPWVI